MNDGLVTATRAFAHMAAILGEGLWPARDGVPRGLDGVDAAWLTAALAEDYPGVRVAAVERLGGHVGTTTRERIALRYDAPGEGGPPPDRLFVKITAPGFGTRLFGSLFRLGWNEVGFYRDVRRGLDVLAPRCYAARRRRQGGRFVLLLEDLALGGARFATVAEPVGIDLARAAVRTLGRLHAGFWQSSRILSRDGDLAWLKSGVANENAAVERWISRRADAPVIRRYRDLLPPPVRERVAEIHARRDRREAWWAEPPLTLIHGDSHVGNMFFTGEGDSLEAGLLDWQVLQRGQGIRDVGYFLMNSLDTDLRRSHQEALLALYLATLRKGGVSEADLDPGRLFERYRSQALYVWIASAVTAATPGLQPEPVARRALQRAAAALEDLEAFQLLDEIG